MAGCLRQIQVSQAECDFCNRVREACLSIAGAATLILLAARSALGTSAPDPANIFSPASPPALEIHHLLLFVLVICAAIFCHGVFPAGACDREISLARRR